MAEREHEVEVAPIPAWVDHERLLGPGGWTIATRSDGSREARAKLDSDAAADLGARLRGVGIDGRPLVCSIEPPLRRPAVRRARTIDARRRRSTTPGFERPGVRLDEEGRWSLTPEALALGLARSALGGGQGRPIVDAGCGLGGNTIAFARVGCPVVAIEADAGRLALARHNAGIYGVQDRVRFIHGDALSLAREHARRDAILFIDPPWGTDWSRERCTLADLPLLAALLPVAAAGYAALWAKLPPSFAISELLLKLSAEFEADAEAVFGEAEGDRRRIKFVLLCLRRA